MHQQWNIGYVNNLVYATHKHHSFLYKYILEIDEDNSVAWLL